MVAVMRQTAREAYERQFTPAQNYARLLEIYQFARLQAESRRRSPRNMELYRPNAGAASA
jgi:hypothetical protein